MTQLKACDMENGSVHEDTGQGAKQRHTGTTLLQISTYPLPVNTVLKSVCNDMTDKNAFTEKDETQ
jgi:hypothetical protein